MFMRGSSFFLMSCKKGPRADAIRAIEAPLGDWQAIRIVISLRLGHRRLNRTTLEKQVGRTSYAHLNRLEIGERGGRVVGAKKRGNSEYATESPWIRSIALVQSRFRARSLP